MNQYSVLLVDDEEDVIQIIIKKLDWETMGFRIVGNAKNGLEALEMAEDLQPDVVMTDIKMPYMDGLTLCRKLKETYQKIKVIIFSGFEEFEYAKEAIKIEAEEYILKPINSIELREVFTRIKKNIDRELDEQRNIEKLRSYYIESIPLLQESFYTALLDGQLPEDRIDQYIRNYQIELKGPYYVVTVLHISVSEQEQLDSFLMTVSVKKLTEEQLENKYNSRAVTHLGEIVVISQLENDKDIIRFTDCMDNTCRLIKRICNVKVTAGIGNVCSQIDQLKVSYQGASNAVSYRVLYGNTRAINIAEIDPQDNADVLWETIWIKKILKIIKMGDKSTLELVVHDFLQQLKKSKMSLQRYRLLIMELIAEIYRFGNDNSINMDTVFGHTIDIYGQVLQLETPEALGKWLISASQKMQDLILIERQDTTKSFVAKATEYVQERYPDKELDIEIVCKYLNVSSAYFCTVFKKETGKTFINYLTDYRMQQAMDLLVNKDEKTYIIADKVGYTDPNYFSYVFKKQFGMSPSKYKMNAKGKT